MTNAGTTHACFPCGPVEGEYPGPTTLPLPRLIRKGIVMVRIGTHLLALMALLAFVTLGTAANAGVLETSTPAALLLKGGDRLAPAATLVHCGKRHGHHRPYHPRHRVGYRGIGRYGVNVGYGAYGFGRPVTYGYPAYYGGGYGFQPVYGGCGYGSYGYGVGYGGGGFGLHIGF